ncbi:hypothetical protein ACQ3VF_26130 [Bacillus toyonensis]|uniref:hypothetical protein n=1 Tax=Bacillus toyonensis TaxID=155322 RepID=UPI003D303C44
MRIDWIEAGLWTGLIVCLTLLFLCCYALYQESEECHNRGGKMVETGNTSTIITYVNNMPIISTYEETECSKK